MYFGHDLHGVKKRQNEIHRRCRYYRKNDDWEFGDFHLKFQAGDVLGM